VHPCPCRRCVTDNAPTYVALAVAAYPPSHSPCCRCCRLPAVAFTSPLLSPPTAQLIFSRQRTPAPLLLLPSQPICSRRRIAFAFRKLPPSPLPAQLIFSRRRTLPPSSPLPSQIICSRRCTHTAAAVAFTPPLSSPPTAQLIFSCRCPHIVSTVPFTCGHPRINPNAFYSHPTRSFIKNIPKICSECTRAHRRCVFTSPSQLECNRCIKMHLICFFNYSGKSLHFPFCLYNVILIMTFCFVLILPPEQGRRTDLLKRAVSGLPQDSGCSCTTIRSHHPNPISSQNIKSDSVHYNPSTQIIVSSGSSCHTADRLMESMVKDRRSPFPSYSLLAPPTLLGPCFLQILCQLLSPHTVCCCCICRSTVTNCISSTSLP
jgi:hypothetical protein